jgi:hypothetical protein
VGGFLVKVFRGNVLPVFGVTAVLQLVAALPLVALIGADTTEQQQEEEHPNNDVQQLQLSGENE